ncbi:MAG: ATP-binding protein [Bacteroidales bacterium]|nr:ATP-binding protein [Bacteroidales bacterium]
MDFLDRKEDMERLRTALKRDREQFIVIYGRRRIGKSTLVKRVLDFERGDIYFMADRTSEASQRQLFSSVAGQSVEGFGLATYPDWRSLLINLSNRLQHRITVCLDEFPYMVKSCPSLPSVLQNFLETVDRKFDLIICGSSQQLMQGLVLKKDEPLYGRADEIFRMKPIAPAYTMQAMDCTAEEAVEEYSVWGGVPRYWELRNNYNTLEAAVESLLLNPGGTLYEEPSRLLHDEMRDTVQASTLMSFIGTGANKLSEIAARAERPASDLAKPLANLRELGFISRHVPFGVDEKKNKKSIYCISDSLLRFHYHYVLPYRSILELGRGKTVLDVFLGQKSDYVAQCWEEICRNHVSGNLIEGTIYNKASRWWGDILDDDGNVLPVELDVVAESMDKRHLLIGECKWTGREDALKLKKRLDMIVRHLPFRKRFQEVHLCLFLKTMPTNASCIKVFLPEEVMREA